MNKESKIYVAGHRGMVGSAIVRELTRQGYTNIITRTHAVTLCSSTRLKNNLCLHAVNISFILGLSRWGEQRSCVIRR